VVIDILLGVAYVITSGLIFRLIYHCMGANPLEYSIIFSKKGLVVSLLYMIGVIALTYAHQSFALEYSSPISWLRLGLLTSIAYITLRLGNLAKQVRNVITNGD